MTRALSVSRTNGNRLTFPEWYQAVVREAEMAEPSPVRGSVAFSRWSRQTARASARCPLPWTAA